MDIKHGSINFTTNSYSSGQFASMPFSAKQFPSPFVWINTNECHLWQSLHIFEWRTAKKNFTRWNSFPPKKSLNVSIPLPICRNRSLVALFFYVATLKCVFVFLRCFFILAGAQKLSNLCNRWVFYAQYMKIMDRQTES